MRQESMVKRVAGQRKKCVKCLSEKPIGEFYPNKSYKDGLVSKCKICSKKQSNAWHITHPNWPVKRISRYYKEYSHQWYKRNKVRIYKKQCLVRAENTRLLDALKVKCIKCGLTKSKQLVFHHPDPVGKKFEVSIRKNAHFKNLVNELSKCVVVCRSCHMKIHSKDHKRKNGRFYKEAK